MCGCSPTPPSPIPNPLPQPSPGGPYPPVPLMRPGFDVLVQPVGGTEGGKACTGWKVDPQNATQEINVCCTPQVGRRGGRYQVAACLKLARQYDPWA